MKYFKQILFLLVVSFSIFSCSKKNKTGKWIPKDAIVVVEINTKSLSSKLSWEDVKQTFWYQQLMADSAHAAKGKPYLEDPAKMGIDLSTNFIFFVEKPNTSGHFVVEGSVKDSKKLATFITTMHPGVTVHKEGELNIASSDEALIGWNNDRFVIVSGIPESPMQKNMPGDSSTYNMPAKLISIDSLLAACKNIFTLKEENSLAENERFGDLVNEKGDVHFWINNDQLYKSSMQKMPGAMGMVNLDKLLIDNIGVATISFDDGKITAKNKWYTGKELSDILKSGDGNFNTEMIKRNPVPNPAMVFAMHFNPENFLGIIRLTGLDGFINLFLGQKGLSLEDVAKATKGDVFFSVSDVTVKKDSTNNQKFNELDSFNKFHVKPGGTFLFSVAVKDKNAFNKIVDLGKTFGKNMTPVNTFSKTDDTYYAFSNSQDAVNNYFAGPASKPAFIDKISGHPMGAFIDVQMILKSMQQAVTADSASQALYNLNIGMWNNIYSTGGEYKDGGLVYNTEVNLVDKSTNSLKQLNKLVDQMCKIKSTQKKKSWEDASKLLPPHSDTVR